MKLAEALILRADLKKRSEQLQERLTRNARIQEGDLPVEEPDALLEEFTRVAADLEMLIRRINRTNASVAFDADLRISDAIAVRDTMDLRIRTLRAVIEAASSGGRLFTRSEIRYVATVDAAVMQIHLDEWCKRRRELDTRLQAANWHVDLL